MGTRANWVLFSALPLIWREAAGQTFTSEPLLLPVACLVYLDCKLFSAAVFHNACTVPSVLLGLYPTLITVMWVQSSSALSNVVTPATCGSVSHILSLGRKLCGTGGILFMFLNICGGVFISKKAGWRRAPGIWSRRCWGFWWAFVPRGVYSTA